MPNAQHPENAVLVTITHSPFCEAARWILRKAGVPFEEHSFHHGNAKLPTIAWRVEADGTRHFATDGGFPGLIEFKGQASNRSEAQARSGAVPFLRFPDGRVLVDTKAIFAYCAEKMGDTFNSKWYTEWTDEKLGVAARCLHYYHLSKYAEGCTDAELARANSHLFFATCASEKFEEVAKDFELNEYTTRAARSLRSFNLDDEVTAKRLVAEMDELLQNVDAEVSKRLEASSGPFLNGKTVSCDDIALAGVFSLLLIPPKRVMADCPSWPAIEQLPANMQKAATACQQSVAGQLALRTYEACRHDGEPPLMLTDPMHLYSKEELDRANEFYTSLAENDEQRLNAATIMTKSSPLLEPAAEVVAKAKL